MSENYHSEDYFTSRKTHLSNNHAKAISDIVEHKTNLNDNLRNLEHINWFASVLIPTVHDPYIRAKMTQVNTAMRSTVLDSLQGLADKMRRAFMGANLAWVEKEQKLVEGMELMQGAHHFLFLYERLVPKLHQLDWELLGVEERIWRENGLKRNDEKDGEVEGGSKLGEKREAREVDMRGLGLKG